MPSGAREFMGTFAEGYNHAHRHSGIGLNTAADIRYGLAAAKPFSGRRPWPPPGPPKPRTLHHHSRPEDPRPARHDLGQAVTADLSGNDIVTGALHRASHHADQW
jgi:hypothetical protein